MSSMLVRHALKVKDEQTAAKPGNYNSLKCAANNLPFPDLPESIKDAIPNGIVVFFEANRSSLGDRTHTGIDSWIIETSGSFRSERLFILAETNHSIGENPRFWRASEIYVKLSQGQKLDNLEKILDDNKFRVIGTNTSSGEHIVQIRNISPAQLTEAQNYLNSLEIVKSTRFYPWFSSR